MVFWVYLSLLFSVADIESNVVQEMGDLVHFLLLAQKLKAG